METSLDDRPTAARHSSLYAWMVDNWPKLSEGEMRWPWLMGKIAEAGLTDASGKVPTLQTARNTLYKVRKAIKRTSRRHEPLPVTAPLPIAQFDPAPPAERFRFFQPATNRETPNPPGQEEPSIA